MKELHARVAGEVRKVVVGHDRGAGGHARRARARRPRAARRRARRGQDAARERDRPRAGHRVPAPAVHARHAALRRDGHDGAARRRSRLPARAGVRRRRAGRRDQPHAAEDPGRAAGGDAGGPGHRRRRVAPAARTRSSSWRPRTRSSTRAPTRCPRPSATASSCTSRSATPRPTRSARCCGSRAAGSRRPALDDVRPVASAEDLRAARARGRRHRGPRRGRRLRRRDRAPHARAAERALGASPRAAVHLLGAAKAAARLAGRAYVTPDDVARMAAPVLRHRLVLTPEAELERATPLGAIRAALEDVPVPR